MQSRGSSFAQAAAAAAVEVFFGCKLYSVAYYIQFRNKKFTMVNPPLKHPPSTNHGHSTLALLETDHPQRAGSNSTENRSISNYLQNSDREVRPDTMPAAGNWSVRI